MWVAISSPVGTFVSWRFYNHHNYCGSSCVHLWVHLLSLSNYHNYFGSHLFTCGYICELWGQILTFLQLPQLFWVSMCSPVGTLVLSPTTTTILGLYVFTCGYICELTTTTTTNLGRHIFTCGYICELWGQILTFLQLPQLFWVSMCSPVGTLVVSLQLSQLFWVSMCSPMGTIVVSLQLSKLFWVTFFSPVGTFVNCGARYLTFLQLPQLVWVSMCSPVGTLVVSLQLSQLFWVPCVHLWVHLWTVGPDLWRFYNYHNYFGSHLFTCGYICELWGQIFNVSTTTTTSLGLHVFTCGYTCCLSPTITTILGLHVFTCGYTCCLSPTIKTILGPMCSPVGTFVNCGARSLASSTRILTVQVGLNSESSESVKRI